jgi:hypothetical protein
MAMTQPLREQLKKGWMQECSTHELCSFSQEKTAKGGGESDEIEVTEFDKFDNRKKVMTEVVLAYTFEG